MMKLETKTLAITLTCLLLIAVSIIPFRWLLLNDVQIRQETELVDTGQQQLRLLKKNVDSFNAIALTLANDEQIKKDFYEKKMTYHSQFDREGVENISDVLQTLYMRDALFELQRFYLKHFSATAKDKKPKINFEVDGSKRLVKE